MKEHHMRQLKEGFGTILNLKTLNRAGRPHRDFDYWLANRGGRSIGGCLNLKFHKKNAVFNR